MDIIFLGHSSFRIKAKEGTVVTDPYDPKMLDLKYPAVEADIVTVSHDHADHNQVSLVSGVKKIIDGPGEYEISGVSIIGIASFHDDKKGAERGKNTIYVYELEGMRIAHLGDLGHELSQETLSAIGDIDIVMIPVGGKYTIGPTQSVRIIQEIEPRVVLPMHYQTPGLNPEVFSGLSPVEVFLKDMGAMAVTLPKLSVKKEEMGEEQKVVVLTKR